MNTTFTKLRNGSWGVKGHGLRAGGVARVTKRSGEVQTVTVDRIVWHDATGLAIASIVSDRPAAPTYRITSRRSSCPTGGNCSSFGNGRSCGAPDCDGY